MIVYKATNMVNGKVYIGQTIQKLEDRITRHKIESNQGIKRHFYDAIRKYGFDQFKWEIIDNSKTEKELDDKEIFWIEYYKSNVRKYGYKYGVTTRIGTSSKKDTYFFLKRLPVNFFDDNLFLQAKLEGAYDWRGEEGSYDTPDGVAANGAHQHHEGVDLDTSTDDARCQEVVLDLLDQRVQPYHQQREPAIGDGQMGRALEEGHGDSRDEGDKRSERGNHFEYPSQNAEEQGVLHPHQPGERRRHHTHGDG